jgi:hypothetical protein
MKIWQRNNKILERITGLIIESQRLNLMACIDLSVQIGNFVLCIPPPVKANIQRFEI